MVASDDTKQDGRRLSFSSSMVAMGSLPPTTKVSDPVIHILISFDSAKSCPSEEDLFPLVDELMKYERMAGIPQGTNGKHNWVFKRINMHNFDPTKMIQKIVCDSSDEANRTIQEFMGMSLRDEDLPYWRFVIIQNSGEGDSHLLLLFDHVIGDGISLGKVIQKLLTNMDGSRVDDLVPKSMITRKKEALGSMWNLVLKVIPSTLRCMLLPFSKFDDDIVTFQGIGKGMVNVIKRPNLITMEPISLSFVKSLKKKAGVTINDVLLAAYSEALNRICSERDCAILKRKKSKTQCRVLMPYVFPSEPEDMALRNKFAFLPIDLEIGYDSMQKRLEMIHKGTQKLKQSPYALCQQAFVELVFPLIPYRLAQYIVQNEFVRFSSTFSNVPGPNKKVKIAGKAVKSCRFFVQHLLPTVNILSYDNYIYVTIVANEDTLPHASLVPENFEKALMDLSDKLGIECPFTPK